MQPEPKSILRNHKRPKAIHVGDNVSTLYENKDYRIDHARRDISYDNQPNSFRSNHEQYIPNVSKHNTNDGYHSEFS